ncbi:hypothetical protein BD324DRAFT_237997 [Kockovaella imperatae]|uniref:Uncharacterized protein n=1 Tax=Kockovaella imperatae TaxID=4999 RepID=A0A1Y1UP59_9TREE|nr:hypothetical protein BD324DRAFT_237997 [Kockovaella imperatae]ORX39830.1 hypothetical protein BD324DRAFT_237997 [Kockovaella imperatae]
MRFLFLLCLNHPFQTMGSRLSFFNGRSSQTPSKMASHSISGDKFMGHSGRSGSAGGVHIEWRVHRDVNLCPILTHPSIYLYLNPSSPKRSINRRCVSATSSPKKKVPARAN